MNGASNSTEQGLKFDSYWIDLLFILLLIYILITVALITSMKNEYETKINLLKQHNKTANDEFGFGTPKISITPKNGKYIFILEGNKLGRKYFQNVPNLLKELERMHPQSLILRVDKESPFKFPQEILIIARKLNINIGFSYEVGGMTE